MPVCTELNRIDRAVLENLRNYGKKIKRYELSFLVKRDVACSDLELINSLKKLSDSDIILESGNNEYLLNSWLLLKIIKLYFLNKILFTCILIFFFYNIFFLTNIETKNNKVCYYKIAPGKVLNSYPFSPQF